MLSSERSQPLADLSPDDNGQSQSLHLDPAPSEYFHDTFDNFSTHTTYDILSEDPVLRLYVIEMFVHHAVAADEAGADPSELLDMLHNGQASEAAGGRWYKWFRFTSESKPGTTPAQFAADRCWYKWSRLAGRSKQCTTPAHFAVEWNLGSWIKWYSHHPSCRHMLYEQGGDRRYPLLEAIYWGHDSIVAILSKHIDADMPVKDPWALLHYLTANKVKANTTRKRCQFIHELLELLELMTSSVRGRGPLDGAISFDLQHRFRSYIERSGVDILDFRSTLLSIQALGSAIDRSSERVSRHESAVRSFLLDLFRQADDCIDIEPDAFPVTGRPTASSFLNL
jgi:hypothetical protein